MLEKKDIQKIAHLARIEVSPEEQEGFVAEISAILAYVDQLKAVDVPAGVVQVPKLRNVLRPDGTPHPTEAFTKELLEEVPSTEGGRVKVKKILS